MKMKNRFLRSMAVAVTAGALMVSMMGMTAFAAVDSLTITKKVTAEANVLPPNTSFTFAVEAVTVSAGTKDANNNVVSSGVAGGAYFASGTDTVTFSPDAADLTKATELSFDASKFSAPGIYRYKVTEQTPGTAYDGMTYSGAEYYVDVYVANSGSAKVVEGVVASKDGSKTGSLEFENTYTTNNLTLIKEVSGNQADLSKKFKFTITINGADGEKFATNYTAPGAGAASVFASGTAYEVELGNNESIVIYGLSAADTYTIAETDYSSEGYSTSVEGADNTSALTATGNTSGEDDIVTYTNTKNVATPTGIMLSIAPYAVMVVLAGVITFLFLRKKRNYDF